MKLPIGSDRPVARSRQVITLPNVISTMRLAIAVGLPLADIAWRLPLLLIGAASDWLDGLIAKLTNTRTVVGQLLDPLADKALFLSAILTLMISGEIQFWQVTLALARDVAVLVVIVTAAARRDWRSFTRMTPSLLGKVTTVLVFAWLVSVMLPWAEPARMVLFTLAAAASLITAVEYVGRMSRALRALRHGATIA